MKEVVPSSITGRAGEPAASVLDHQFGAGDPYTLGVEEEYMLLDPVSFDLVQHIETVLDAVQGDELADRLNPELMQSVLEIATPVCRTAGDVQRELTTLRGYVRDVAAAHRLRVGSAGTHPFSLFERQRITAKDRYRVLIDQLQYVARRELIFGMHVHVAVDDPDKAIQVVNGLLPHLAPLLALSASSPFWRGEPTGLASSRQIVFSAFPRSGPPPRFRDYEDYASVVGQLERTGCIADYTHIWWDIRPHPKWGTIEVRICDAVTRLEDAVAIAAYCQSVVKLLCERYEAGQEIPTFHRILTSENKWLAARYGLDAPIMDLPSGRRNRVPISKLVRRTLRDLEPHARELGCDDELDGIRALLDRGNSAEQQLRVFNANRDITEVVRGIADATEELPAAVGATPSRPTPRPASRPSGFTCAFPRTPPSIGARCVPEEPAARASCPAHPAGEPAWSSSASSSRAPFPRTVSRAWTERRAPAPAYRSADLSAAGIRVVGISLDSPWSHRAWAESLGLGGTVTLLSDGHGEVARAFGVLGDLNGLPMARRSIFLVRDGMILDAWALASPLPDVDAIIAASAAG